MEDDVLITSISAWEEKTSVYLLVLKATIRNWWQGEHFAVKIQAEMSWTRGSQVTETLIAGEEAYGRGI